MSLRLADENFPGPAIIKLRELGHDVLTLLDIGMAGLAILDDKVLSLSTSMNRCLLTLNRKDFIKLHTLQPNHTGIIICKADPDFRRLAERIDECLRQSSDLTGRLLRVQRPSV